MSLLTVLVLVIAVAACLFLIRWAGQKLAVDPWLLNLAYFLIGLVVVVFVFRALGIFSMLSEIRI